MYVCVYIREGAGERDGRCWSRREIAKSKIAEQWATVIVVGKRCANEWNMEKFCYIDKTEYRSNMSRNNNQEKNGDTGEPRTVVPQNARARSR